jgi:succinate-semialdehyde dehydrogenase/glutarate-semialdehyde dehydrogenase
MTITAARIKSINPATDEELASFEEFSPEQVDQALAEADAAYRAWRERSFAERAVPMRQAAEVLRQNKADYGRLISLEMGKPITEAEAEVEKCAWACEFYAEHAERFLADEHVETNALDSYVAFEPLGVVLAIMPWNFPFWQVFRFAAPALMAGNAAVLKHASNVPQCALAVEEIFVKAGFPKGLFRAVLVGGSAAERMIVDPRVRAVTLTGSSEVGEQVASAAGRNLKKQVLELGGSDPFIVLKDADLDAAVETAVRARFQNSGQSCICAKRFIVEESVADEFERRFSEAAAKLKVGDPQDRETRIGPLARADLAETLERQVEQSVGQGARVLLGGKRIAGQGNFFEPTILSGVTPEVTAFREETFGPVAAVVRAKNAQEALELANDSEYGLGASIWTRDLEQAQRLARRIESGAVFVNGLVASDPRLPFGGVKRSGYGRELAAFGIREFTNIQSVCVYAPTTAAPPLEKVATD